MIHAILIILHVLTASAWFGLSIRLGSQAKLAASGQLAVAVDGARTISLMGILLIATFLFSMTILILGGGYPGQIQYHISSTLIIVLLVLQFVFLRPTWNNLRTSIESTNGDQEAGLKEGKSFGYARRISMFAGIGHLLWLTLLVLMFWNRFVIFAFTG